MLVIKVFFDSNTSFVFDVNDVRLGLSCVIQIEQGINLIFLVKLNETAITSFKLLREACGEDGRDSRSGLTTLSFQNDFKLCFDAWKSRIEQCASADGNDFGCR